MRFITEFELLLPAVGARVNAYKEQSSNDIGKEIGDAFDWGRQAENKHMRWTLEIEAFPMDKWVEFKRKLFSHIEFYEGNVSGTHILGLIKELEFNGKPSGDAITNQQLNK